MSGTPNLNVTHVLQNQSQKEVTINAGLDALDDAANKVAVISLAADRVLTAAEFNGAGTIRFTNGGIAAPATITLPANSRQITIDNGCGQTLTITHGAGETLSVANGEIVGIVCDGTDVKGIGAASGTGISAIGDLSDVDTASAAPTAGDRLEWNGTQWVPAYPEFVAMSSLSGKPGAGVVVLKVVAGNGDGKFRLPVGLADSRAHASAAATSASSYSIKRNGTAVGSIAFAAGATTATFTLASEAVFGAGDIMEIVGPAVQDTTLSDVAITLVGIRR